MGWTDQQQDAISARNTSVIVSAAAGSGKTAVLTERLVQLISDPASGVRADRMVVVTFTNDAAAELKKRLDTKLRALINEAPSDSHLLKQQTLLQSAKIATINSFCFDLLRDNITDQGITTGFGVLDETDNAVLKSKAMDELLNWMSENEYEKISLLYDRFCIRNVDGLKKLVGLTDNFLASAALRDKWLDKAVQCYEGEFKESVYYSALLKMKTDLVQKALKAADECIAMISSIFPDMSVPAAEKSAAQAEEDYDRVSSLLAVFRKGMIPDESECEYACNFSRLVSLGKAVYDKALREIYKKKRDSIKNIMKKAVSGFDSVESDFRESGEVTVILAEVMKKYNEIIWRLKCEKNAISFDDGERLALELLADIDENGNIIQSEAARKTAEYYDIIMIDEYQDSNNKQDMIFKLISKNYRLSENGKPMYGDNAFLVGDVKQSIYGFRLANPRNFIETLHSSAPYNADSNEKNQYILLNRNFRSSQNVIDFVNFVFEEIMSERCGDIEYNDDEKLYFGAEYYTSITDEKSRTVINFINDEASEEEESDEEINNEVLFTAQKIAEMVKSGAEVTENDGKIRPCLPSDFCIIVRKNKYINVYADQLIKLGIPAKGNEEKGYLRSREIAVLIDLLRIINNPLQDISMAAVMLSPMYMFSIQELAMLRALDKKLPLFSVLRGAADGEFADMDDMFLAERCRNFLDSIDKFRLDSVTMTIGELISSIYDTTDFISVMQLYSDGEKKRANLRALIQFAENYEQASAFEGSGGLGGFLRHLDRIMENGDCAQGSSSAASGDYVTVQTFHRSKGLEFPFVFIAENSDKFRFDTEQVMCSADGRIGYILCDPKLYRKYKTFQLSMLAAESRRNTRSEEMRLFYVGLTRAKQKLFINLKCGEKQLKRVRGQLETCVVSGGIEDIVSEAERYSDWIWAVLMRHSDFHAIAEKLELAESGDILPQTVSSKKLFDCVFAENVTVLDSLDNVEYEKALPNDEICSELEDIINDSYDRTLSLTPAKLSVTEITKKLKNEESIPDYRLKRPRFISGSRRLTGSERGTAIHTFFQYCDFENACADVKTEIETVCKRGFITPSQAEAVSPKKASAFFRNEIYSRIKAAGDKVWREKKFMVAVAHLDIANDSLESLKRSDGMIKGIMDLVFEEDDGLVILDYKSDRGMSESELRERYKMQLLLYKAAAELTMKKKVKQVCLYSFELEKTIEVTL